jgi:N-acyl-D-amino-acid deacylase
MAYDLIIRGGTVVDGSGLPGFQADIGITDGMIVKIGSIKGESAKETIDAEGHVVSPGFVDGHTHFDAQIFWDPLGTNSCWHGVTSAVMGNCGFSLAPCSEKDKELVYDNLERAEDLSPAALNAGVPWSWETFSEYLDTVDALPKGINYSGYVGHSALRTHVMGERAFTDTANQDDMAAMTRELENSMRAGAAGFSTSRSLSHRTPDGKPVASRVGDWSEVCDLVGTMTKMGGGVFEIAREMVYDDAEHGKMERQQIKDLALSTGVPMTFGAAWYRRASPDEWRPNFEMIDETCAAGGKILLQGGSHWNGSLRSFETLMLFDNAPVWKDFRKLPLEEQEKGLRNPEMRAKLLEAARNFTVSNDPSLPNVLLRAIDWNWIFPMDRPLPPYRSVAEIAKERGTDAIETMIDLALEKHLKMFFINPGNNEDQDYVRALINHPRTAVTFSDSGAHVNSTLNPVQAHLLGHWVRAEQAMTLEAAVRKITFDIASFWGLKGRGLLREGWCADVCIFDPDTISPSMPSLAYDLPAGAERLIQKADGIKATIVNGEVLIKDNEHTGNLPGRLIRGALAVN